MTKINPYDTNRAYRRPDERLKNPYDLSRGFVPRQPSLADQVRKNWLKRILEQIEGTSPYDASVPRLF